MAYTDKLRVVYGDYTLGVHGEGFDYIFSYYRRVTAEMHNRGFMLNHKTTNASARSFLTVLRIVFA